MIPYFFSLVSCYSPKRQNALQETSTPNTCKLYMKKNSNDIEGPQNDIFGGAMSEEEFLNSENGGEDDWEDEGGPCEVYDAVMSAIFLSRPLGILWDDDIIEEYLKFRKYKIVERTDDDGEVYTVPVKAGSKIIPDRRDSLRRVFDREVQEALLTWLKKIR